MASLMKYIKHSKYSIHLCIIEFYLEVIKYLKGAKDNEIYYHSVVPQNKSKTKFLDVLYFSELMIMQEIFFWVDSTLSNKSEKNL